MDDDFWGEFTQDYSGGTDALFNFGDSGTTFDTSGALNYIGGGSDATIFDARDFLDTSWLNDIVSGLDLKGGDASWLDTFDFPLSYDPGEGYGIGILPGGGSAEDVRAFFGESAGEGYGTGVLPGGGNLEDIRQFFGDVSGQTTIPSWARDAVDAGSLLPNYDGTYTQIFDDGSSQTLDYRGNVVTTTNVEGLTYDKNGVIVGGPRAGEKVTTSDIRSTSTSTSGGGAGGGKGGDGGKGGGGGGGGTKTPGITQTLKDNAALIALLGGLLGLLGKGSGSTAPAGYKGSIPKYTATRGRAEAPTTGGRRPGGEGIPSLTGGVTYKSAAGGGLMDLAQGGRPARYLRGGTDGMADKIETDIDGKQPARLSHGEFVIPADVVSHLGNGNSDAGADVLYDMMDKVRKARTGTTKQGKQINPRKMLPA